MIDNILKKEKFRINLSKNVPLNKIINIEQILSYDFKNNTIKINGFSISKKGRFFIIKKGRFFNSDKFKEVYDLAIDYQDIVLKYKNMFLNINSDEAIITQNQKELISYIYYDLIILLEIAAKKQQLELNNDQEKEKIKMLLGADLEFSEVKKKKKSKHYVRPNLTERANKSFYWNNNAYSQKIDQEILSIVENINANEIEFPYTYDREKLLKLLTDFNHVLKKLGIKKRDFEIRFKKIGHYKKTGMYIKNAKCIIVDPRFSTSIYHELGHFIYEEKIDFNLHDQHYKAENLNLLTKQQKENYIEKIRIHRIEGINENSEIFAYWFEDQIETYFYKK